MTLRNPAMPSKNTQKKILQEITENIMEKILDMVNQGIQIHSRNFETPKIKNIRHKQINELKGNLNKHQSKTEDTIKREISELKMKIKKY
jgi:gas vesicle protein